MTILPLLGFWGVTFNIHITIRKINTHWLVVTRLLCVLFFFLNTTNYKSQRERGEKMKKLSYYYFMEFFKSYQFINFRISLLPFTVMGCKYFYSTGHMYIFFHFPLCQQMIGCKFHYYSLPLDISLLPLPLDHVLVAIGQVEG